jgi:hypothetical protein
LIDPINAVEPESTWYFNERSRLFSKSYSSTAKLAQSLNNDSPGGTSVKFWFENS